MWSIIPKEKLDEYINKYSNLRQCEGKEFLLWENDTHYVLPRYFCQKLPHYSVLPYHDKNYKPEIIDDFEFNGTLRPEQDVAAKVLKNQYYQSSNVLSGIIKARPGYGKTVLAAYLSCFLKKKTLIILDNTKLKDQWIDAFVNFTNLTEDNIGVIQGKKLELDKPVAIAMVQTLMSKVKRDLKKNYILFRDAGYGVVFFDETHATSSAPKFSLSSLLLNTPNIIGLTATPFLRDINKLLMENIVGDVIYETKKYDLLPKIFFVNYSSGLGPQYSKRMNYSRDYIKKQAFYNSVTHKSIRYLDLIYRLASKCVKKGHKTIIVVSTIKQLDAVHDYLANRNLKPIKFFSDQQVINKEKDDLIVATLKMSGKGFDYAELSAAIIGLPIKGKVSLIQFIGRILRSKPGKRDPVVFDLIDNDFNIFASAIGSKKKHFIDEFGPKCQMEEVQA